VNCAGLASTLLQSQLFGHRRGAFTGAFNDHIGVFEAASGGTLLLDEVGDISKEVQISLLRVLEERRIWRLGDTNPTAVDVRVVVATHRNLAELVAEGQFRADLLYRIRVARVSVPPLRTRPGDVMELARTFLARSAATAGRAAPVLLPDAEEALKAHSWPGNVRELRAAMDYAVICTSSGGDVGRDRLPPEVVEAQLASEPTLGLPSDPREQLLVALEATAGNRAAAARLLRISRTTLYRRIEDLDVDPDSARN
jgi:transcriptional regulator with PAS, ATPase and Fis domain